MKEKDGDTLLHWAAYKGNVDISELLLRHGADPNQRNDVSNSPLHDAVLNETKDQLNVVKLLIQNGAHVNEKGMNGATPLHYAANNVNTSIADLLLS
ncbi:hypothetical protein CAPTEDRAFT_104768, partial [Capitella teleta]